MELRARVNHLAERGETAPAFARKAVVDVPLAISTHVAPKAFQRIARRQESFVPELDVAAVWFHEPASRKAAKHPRAVGRAVAEDTIGKARREECVANPCASLADGIGAGGGT